jgi:hypothetical protein
MSSSCSAGRCTLHHANEQAMSCSTVFS